MLTVCSPSTLISLFLIFSAQPIFRFSLHIAPYIQNAPHPSALLPSPVTTPIASGDDTTFRMLCAWYAALILKSSAVNLCCISYKRHSSFGQLGNEGHPHIQRSAAISRIINLPSIMSKVPCSFHAPSIRVTLSRVAPIISASSV